MTEDIKKAIAAAQEVCMQVINTKKKETADAAVSLDGAAQGVKFFAETLTAQLTADKAPQEEPKADGQAAAPASTQAN